MRHHKRPLAQVQENGKALAQGNGIHACREEGGVVVIEVGSGDYEFASKGLTLSVAMAKVRHVAGRLDAALGVGQLVKNQKAREILVRELGEEMIQRANHPFMGDQTLEALAMFAPQVLTPEKIAAIQAQLIAIH